MLEPLTLHFGFAIDTPWEDLPEGLQHVILHGSGREEIPFHYLGEGGRKVIRRHRFDGVIPSLERRYKESESQLIREELARYIATSPCPECGGSRLRIEARNVTIHGRTLHDLSRLPIRQTLVFFDELKLTGNRAQVAQVLEGAQQAVVVALVQADGGLVQHVHDAGEAGADLARQADALGLAAGQGVGGTFQG